MRVDNSFSIFLAFVLFIFTSFVLFFFYYHCARIIATRRSRAQKIEREKEINKKKLNTFLYGGISKANTTRDAHW